MIRVLHVTNAYPTESKPDFGVFIKEQIESLDSGQINSEILSIGNGGGLKGYLSSITSVRRAAAEVDVVHCHHMLSGAVAIFAGARSKSVVSFLSDGALNYKGRPRILGHLLFEFVSSASRFNIYKSRVPFRFRKKSLLIPNGVDFSRFTIGDELLAKERLGLSRDKKYLLFVSAVSVDRPEKRFDFFRQVIVELEKRRPGEFDELVMSNVRRDLVPVYFQAASMHLLCSTVEGSPNSIKEALASGVPVVSRDVGGVRFLLEEVQGCALFKADDAGRVADMVLAGIESDAKAVRENFERKGLSMESIAGKLQSVYQELVKDP